MWIYKKSLQHPMKVCEKDPRMAKVLLTQYGGPDGEAGAALRYLTQRYYMPLAEGSAMLTDIGTEELGHIEMVGTLFSQLVCGVTKHEMINSGLDGHYVEHGCNPFYVSASGYSFTSSAFTTKGDPVVDMYENLAVEQKARITYEHLIQLTDDPLLKGSLRFLREREVVHFQRFGEILRLLEEDKMTKKVF